VSELSSDELALMATRALLPTLCRRINASTERGGYNDIWNTDLSLD